MRCVLMPAAPQPPQGSLEHVASSLCHHGESRPLSESELPVFESACKAFATTLCPYAAACFDRVYPGGGQLVDARRIAAPVLELARPQ